MCAAITWSWLEWSVALVPKVPLGLHKGGQESCQSAKRHSHTTHPGVGLPVKLQALAYGMFDWLRLGSTGVWGVWDSGWGAGSTRQG